MLWEREGGSLDPASERGRAFLEEVKIQVNCKHDELARVECGMRAVPGRGNSMSKGARL